MDFKLFLMGLVLALLGLFSKGTLSFVLSGLGIIVFALVSADITEELSKYYSPTIGGLINATLGNIGELIIGFFALKEGLGEVVKASITGSIIGNLLLLFGMATFVGGLFYKTQFIKKKVSEVNSTMLMITLLLILFPSMLNIFHEEKYSLPISLFISVVMLSIYFGSLLFSLITHRTWFLSKEEGKPSISKERGWLYLILSVLVLSLLSERFASLIEETAHAFGFNELFIGAIIVGLVGNVGEHLSSIKFAYVNKFDLVVSTSVGSALQIALFVLPVLVLLGFWIGEPITLNFLPIEIASILASVLLINEVIKDAEVNWFEGVQLIALYLIIALVFFFAQ